jgi:hypothetical protein
VERQRRSDYRNEREPLFVNGATNVRNRRIEGSISSSKRRFQHCGAGGLSVVSAATKGEMMPRRSEIQDVVQEFVAKLSSLIEQESVSRAREVILGAFGGKAPAGLRLRGAVRLSAVGGLRKRRKGPIQLCPVPGCANRAAPVFGMVCSKHKDLPKAEIKKYREQRREKKLKAKSKAKAKK